MSQSCTEVREVLIGAQRGELQPLALARVESHVAHCRSCAGLRQALNLGLQAAQRWQPTLEPAHTERLLGRLSPYLEPRRPSLWWSWALVAAAAGLLVTAGAFAWSRLRPAPTPVARTQPAAAPAPLLAAPLVPRQVGPALRLLLPADWDGEVRENGPHTEIALRRGFVAVGFTGGAGRSVAVVRGALRVRAVGTRFSVEAAGEGGAIVAVAEGRVRVVGPAGELELAAGEARAFAADGAARAAAPSPVAVLDDPFLRQPVAPRPPSRPRPAPAPDVAAALERAEALLAARRVDEAEELFLVCVEDPAPAYDAYRDLCRLQLARLWGQEPAKRPAARALLEQLARGGRGAVSREAALLGCELELKESPCAAARCLTRLAAAGDRELGDEAERLRRRWRLDAVECD